MYCKHSKIFVLTKQEHELTNKTNHRQMKIKQLVNRYITSKIIQMKCQMITSDATIRNIKLVTNYFGD